jgi:hypothetical protein
MNWFLPNSLRCTRDSCWKTSRPPYVWGKAVSRTSTPTGTAKPASSKQQRLTGRQSRGVPAQLKPQALVDVRYVGTIFDLTRCMVGCIAKLVVSPQILALEQRGSSRQYLARAVHLGLNEPALSEEAVILASTMAAGRGHRDVFDAVIDKPSKRQSCSRRFLSLCNKK